MAELHAKLDSPLERIELQLNARIDRVAGDLNARIDARLFDVIALLELWMGEPTRWLFEAWASLLIPIIGLWIRG